MVDAKKATIRKEEQQNGSARGTTHDAPPEQTVHFLKEGQEEEVSAGLGEGREREGGREDSIFLSCLLSQTFTVDNGRTTRAAGTTATTVTATATTVATIATHAM